MRVLFLSSIFPRPYAPTLGIYCAQLCEALSATHEVRVVSPQSWPERLRYGRVRGCPDEAGGARLRAEYPCYFYPPGCLQTTYGWFMWASIRPRVRELFKEFAPDCVLSYWAHPDGEAAVRAARLAGVPAVVIVGGSDVHVLGRERRRGRCVANVLRAAHAVAAVSGELRERVIELGVPPGKVHVVHQGIDTSLFCPGDREQARARLGISGPDPAFVWVGRMVPVKGLDVLLAACERLRGEGCLFRVYLVGDGPLRDKLQEESINRGLAGAVHFVGPRLPHELPDWYRAADATVLPSRMEGLPNVLRESLACGVPCVATYVGGIPEIAGEAPNILVPPEDPAALADALEFHCLLAGRGARPRVPPPGFDGWAAAAEKTLSIVAAPRLPSGRDELLCTTGTHP
jgi:glycosyltransferase involved in cell wall biosynthesis